jgi:hypothetical protein
MQVQQNIKLYVIVCRNSCPIRTQLGQHVLPTVKFHDIQTRRWPRWRKLLGFTETNVIWLFVQRISRKLSIRNSGNVLYESSIGYTDASKTYHTANATIFLRMKPRGSKHAGKKKTVPLQAWSGPEGCRKLRFPDLMKTSKDGGKVVSLMHRPPLPPGHNLVLISVRG